MNANAAAWLISFFAACLLVGGYTLVQQRRRHIEEARRDALHLARVAGCCQRIEDANIVTGWGCCCCQTYNSEARTLCKFCEHERCDVWTAGDEARWAAAGGDGGGRKGAP